MACVERWQQRYRDISRENQRLLQRKPGEMAREHALAFLEEGEAASDVASTLIQSIHHLKDWLINDPQSGLSKPEVEAFINGSPTLRMVADLCNGSKHAVLKRRRSDQPVEILGLSVSSEPGTISKFVTTPDAHVDVNDFADAAIGEWNEFLSQRGLYS
jgi:hypothetical protein